MSQLNTPGEPHRTTAVILSRVDSIFSRDRRWLAASMALPVAFQVLHRCGLAENSPFGLLTETFPQFCLPLMILFACAGFPVYLAAAALAGGTLISLSSFANASVPFAVNAPSWGGLLALAAVLYHLVNGDRERARAFCWGSVPVFFTALVAPTGLELGRRIFSTSTYDGILMHMEAGSFGGTIPFVYFLSLSKAFPWTRLFLDSVYQALNLVVAAAIGFSIRYGYRRISMPLYFVFSGFFVGFFYGVMPVAGPRAVLAVTKGLVSFAQTLVPGEYEKNGMPSMHFGWALAVVYLSFELPSRALRYFAVLFLVLTGFSTLSTGEHHSLDLVIGAPFALALLVPLKTGADVRLRWKALCIFVACVLFWYNGIMIGYLAVLPPFALGVFILVSAVLTFLGGRMLRRA